MARAGYVYLSYFCRSVCWKLCIQRKGKSHLACPRVDDATNASAGRVGHLKDLNAEQRERVLAFLLEKIHVLQGKDSSILGLARPTSQGIVLPDMDSQSAAIPRCGASINPITAALDPDGIHDPPKMPMTPPPKTIMPFWGGYPAGVVLHRKSAGGAGLCTVSAGTQTADPELESADRLLDKVMQDVRPWGTRARHHPAVVKAPVGRKNTHAAAAGAVPPQGAAVGGRSGTAGGARQRAAVATPQGRVPKFSHGALSGGPASAGTAAGGDLGPRGEGVESGAGGGRAQPLPSHFVAVTPPPPSLQSDERSGRSILDSVDRP